MDILTLEQTIRSEINHLPKKTRRVAEYILANSSEVAFQSISETAEKLSVSRAQLVRVARMLGFNGYADLKHVLKGRLIGQLMPASQNPALCTTEEGEIISELCRIEHSNIDQTSKSLELNKESIKKFCEIAASANVIYCMGWGISAVPAEWLYTRFAELGLKSVLMRRGSLSLIEQARGITKGDMLVVCELPSYVIEVTEAVEKISQQGTFVATVTDSPAAPVCSYSGAQFFVSDSSPLFGSSLVGMMFAVHVLTSSLVYKMGKAGERALASQGESLRDERVYYPTMSLRY